MLNNQTIKKAQSIPDFCKEHGISKSLFYKLMKDGKAPATIKLGKRRLVTIEGARQWLKAMSEASA